MRPRRLPARAAGPARAEGGIALLIVLVVLFIVAVLMVDITLTASTARRAARNASSDFLMEAVIDGRRQVAAAQLLYDARENAFDSLNDRWAREEFNDVEATAEEPEEGEEELNDEGARLVADSDEVTVTVKVEDEEAKFNLNLLMDTDKARRESASERLAILLDRYREDTPLDLTAAKAAELRDKILEYLERTAPGEGESGRMPVAKSGAWKLLTPDELRMVEGFEVPERGWTAEFLLYDARDPDEVAAWREAEEEGDKPVVHPGLLRYVTLWSGSAWVGNADPASWLKINVNTAAKPVLETLFAKSAQDMALVEKILEYRDTAKEEQPDAPSGAELEPVEQKQVFEKLDDLKKVDGIDDQVLTRNGIGSATVTVTSSTFSLDFLAERKGAYKQVRYVLRRHAQGIQTLLREERNDPRFDDGE
jgi:hypothetical protein